MACTLTSSPGKVSLRVGVFVWPCYCFYVHIRQLQLSYCPFQATWPRDFFYQKKTTQLRSTISPQRVNRTCRKGHRWTRKNSCKTIFVDRAIQDNFLSYRFFRVRAFIVQKFTDLLGKLASCPTTFATCGLGGGSGSHTVKVLVVD